MAGIYIHIPFCKQACSYCDFHFSTKLSNKEEVLQTIEKEIQLKADYLGGEAIESIYLGGGTPSLLTATELSRLFNQLQKTYTLKSQLEVTLEANPDDLSIGKLKALKQTPINRLSIGVQSFFDIDLQVMNRAHTAVEALNAIKNAQNIGFENISIDLIFGNPTTSNEMWSKNLNQFFALDLSHLSAYSLTVEEKTTLAHQIEKKTLPPLDDEKNYHQYNTLQGAIQTNGFEQYELSNYCKQENYAKHNMGYWQGKKYIGIGPSAHSFNGNSRQWNYKNNRFYIQNIQKGKTYFECEYLSEIDQYHEYLLTSLRTKWGVKLQYINSVFSENLVSHFNKQLNKINKSKVNLSAVNLSIKKEFLFQADEVVRTLMIDS